MRVRLATTALLAAATIGSAHAGTIVDTFGPSQTYNTSAADTVNYNLSNATLGESLAEAVDPSASGVISDIAAAFYFLGSGNPTAGLTLSLESGTAGGPTTSLWSTSFTPIRTPQVFDFTGLSISVSAGSFYWLVASTADPTGYGWNHSSAGLSSPTAYYATSVAPTIWNPVGDVLAYSVSTGAASVPEPATLPILCAGALLSLLVARRPRRG